MKRIKWSFLIYAFLSTASIMGIGIAIGEKSVIGGVGCVTAFIFLTGLGFKTKQKIQGNGKL